MTWTVRITPEAEAELYESARWHDDHGGSDRFMAAMNKALSTIADAALRHPLWRPDSVYRKYGVRKLSYLVIYRVDGDDVSIVAFAHTSRRAGYWLER